MSIDLAGFQNKAKNAIKTFWGKREAARQKPSTDGKADQGERAGSYVASLYRKDCIQRPL